MDKRDLAAAPSERRSWKESERVSHSVMSGSLGPRGPHVTPWPPCEPARLLRLWTSPEKNTGGGAVLLSRFPALQGDSSRSEPPEKTRQHLVCIFSFQTPDNGMP